ncbi:MFS transporter [Streptomyces endophyticus]|uniref:MFS transporter n=1 Tax=Streptomyces endophyticus TaxID=714166 RepID=A0ABU6FB87_9ACTN|nr:MFS transporter [Streptomyces endophyticus]MEB8340605.1 MFS transporter [Streptomyces endophyticus]
MAEGTRPSVIRSPGVPHLMTVVLCCFSGFALLLPVSPQWALDGGADELGAGLVTAVLMTMTVVSQLCVKATLRKLGWARTFALGALLLGLPAPLQALSDNLWPILATTALRGAGFGIMTVCGATAVAALAPRGRQGAAIGLYGLSIALPQMVLTPAAPALVAAFALPVILACGILPVLALPFTPALGRALDAHADTPAPGPSAPRTATAATLRRILMPVILLLLVTVAGGAILTFTPQFAGTPGAAAGALVTFTASAAVTRWSCGVLADRFSARPLNFGLLLAACVGLCLVAWSVRSGTAVLPGLLAGLLLLGAAYGGLQSITLVQALNRAGAENRHTTSVAWNIGFDAGTGLGSLLLGLAAQVATFSAGFLLMAAATAIAAALTLRSGDGSATPPSPRHAEGPAEGTPDKKRGTLSDC